MCGIFGVATIRGRSVNLPDSQAEALRDRLSHRGPDGSGLWRSGRVGETDHVLLTHRRLAVVDRSEAAAQPMVRRRTGGGEQSELCALAYNGELYNNAELREELALLGVSFASESDAETVLQALMAWGPGAVARLRGMFALAFYDAETDKLVLARDPLGIKPLYCAAPEAEAPLLVFASEPGAILGHPRVKTEPDLVTVSAYLTTIRTTLGGRTLFAGVRAVQPGQVLLFDLSGSDGPSIAGKSVDPNWFGGLDLSRASDEDRVAMVREAVTDSVKRHLRSDVPVCTLLSGGLDSTIIATCAKGALDGDLRTYCAGHNEGREDDDVASARREAKRLGTTHADVPISRQMFSDRWVEMVGLLGVPLSTPNEVAINEVCRRLRADGQVVALSGEGADELFGGYELPLRQALDWETNRAASVAPNLEDPGLFQLLTAAWVRPADKGQILRPEVWRGVEKDAALGAYYTDQFAALGSQVDDSPLASHLRFQRRINLTGLLGRLDTAAMLEGVEGRTPLADIEIARLAEALPMRLKIDLPPGAESQGTTKVALRRAFERDLSPATLRRAKASFPLPFETWIGDQASMLRRSDSARAVFTPAAIEHVAKDPGKLWNLAWPMINIAIWGERWWGSGRLAG